MMCLGSEHQYLQGMRRQVVHHKWRVIKRRRRSGLGHLCGVGW